MNRALQTHIRVDVCRVAIEKCDMAVLLECPIENVADRQ